MNVEPVEHRVRVTVHDNGLGFEMAAVPPGHHGLLGMRVRVESHSGTLTIESANGRGTLIRAELPVSGLALADRDEPECIDTHVEVGIDLGPVPSPIKSH